MFPELSAALHVRGMRYQPPPPTLRRNFVLIALGHVSSSRERLVSGSSERNSVLSAEISDRHVAIHPARDWIP